MNFPCLNKFYLQNIPTILTCLAPPCGDLALLENWATTLLLSLLQQKLLSGQLNIEQNLSPLSPKYIKSTVLHVKVFNEFKYKLYSTWDLVFYGLLHRDSSPSAVLSFLPIGNESHVFHFISSPPNNITPWRPISNVTFSQRFSSSFQINMIFPSIKHTYMLHFIFHCYDTFWFPLC